MDFTCSSSEILLNPRLDVGVQARIRELIDQACESHDFSGHFFVASSGTAGTHEFKFAALSKKAILVSAKAVNQHLNASSSDIWLNPLPEFHVGGLGVYARAYLSASDVIPLRKWSPHEFVSLISSHSITLTSLVPAQVYDLIVHELKAPKSIRAIIVGGGALSSAIYEKAATLGWPLLCSYGLTECASQVATSTLNNPTLQLLNHIEAAVDSHGYLQIKSEALLSAYLFITGDKIDIIDPIVNGWLTTEDLATINGNNLIIHGRSSDFIKIGGESVSFASLEKRFEEIKCSLKSTEDACLIPVPDARLGFVIHLAVTSIDTKNLIETYNANVLPYERIRCTHLVDAIPRTSLKKICKQELLKKIS